MSSREITVTTNDLISVQDAAEALKRPRITLYRWIAKGKLVSVKFGGIYYIPVSEVTRLKNTTSEGDK